MAEAAINKPGAGGRLVKDWTRGNIFKNLLLLSWPLIISHVMSMIGPTIDMIWVGRLGPDAIAAVGVSGIIVMFIMTAMMGIAIGTRALIARFIGMRLPDDAVRVAMQAFLISIMFSVVIALVGIIFSDFILSLLGVEAEVLRLGSAYLKVNFCGAVIMSSVMVCESIMQSSGDTITPMVLGILSKIFHVLFSPLFIFGWLFVPGMGVVGAAIASVAAQLIGLTMSLFVLFTGKSR
ncbi:MAG: hypothetical protein GX846_02450 [Deltaproteobacteria bacterium]|nr:hypothetical protein [Deltaproteobacteria bacterium]